jgi:hypothetical protein
MPLEGVLSSKPFGKERAALQRDGAGRADMFATRLLFGMAVAAAVAGCDDIESIVDTAAHKGGGTDVPEAAREPLDADQQDALRRRIEGQNFN